MGANRRDPGTNRTKGFQQQKASDYRSPSIAHAALVHNPFEELGRKCGNGVGFKLLVADLRDFTGKQAGALGHQESSTVIVPL